MTLRIRYHPEAGDEQVEAVDYYEQIDPDLGVDLLARVRVARAAMAKHPESFALLQGEDEVRRATLDRFPYRLIYVLASEDEIFVLAFAHDRREPRYWEHRLDDV